MKYIVGIDEVGRGPLAGPVTVGVVVCEAEFYKKLKRNKNLPQSGKDSKKLSPQAREKYIEVLNDLKISCQNIFFDYSIVHISNKDVDRNGISKCIKKATARAFEKLEIRNLLKIENCELKILLDGGLRAPAEFKNQKTIVRGDEKEKIIAWASILAKVSRDELMRQAGKKCPQYGFEIHKGYGTVRHLAAISAHGLSPLHRKTFCKKYFIDF
jgi:ribonuclease HII